MPPEESVVLIDGPWTHREVTANGARFHLAEHGPEDGPLVLLLHGFPEFGSAGMRVVAPDLRGYGGSDKPPRGYDAYTLSSDVAGMIRALGAPNAHLVGHDWGGLLAWAVATLHPSIVRSLAVLGMPHPIRMRQALLRDPAQLRASSNDAAYVERLLRRWGGPGFPDAETAARCRAAMQIPGVAHSSLEWYRWAVRSQSRPSGVRFLRLMARGVQAPVLQIHGAVDSCTLPATAQGSAAYAPAGHTMHLLDGVGHFPHEEAPDRVSALLLEHARA
jgi:pimeloyl-ACP methyl ester carboxylesterase